MFSECTKIDEADLKGRRRRGRQRMRWLDGTTNSDGLEFEQAPGAGDIQGSFGVLQSVELQRVRHD